MQRKQALILQKNNQKLSQLLQKKVNEDRNEENQITPFNKLGKFTIEGWLDCQNLNQQIQLKYCELNIKQNESNKIYLYSQNREIGRFQYKGEKIFYYLLYEKYIEILVGVNEEIQKCATNKEFSVVQISIEINLFANPFLFNQDNTLSEQNKMKFIFALLKLQEFLKESFLFNLYPIEKQLQFSGPCYSSNIILEWMIERETGLSSISNQKFRGGVFFQLKQGYIFDRFYDLINYKARRQARKSQTLIITFDQFVAEERKQEIQIKYPSLSVCSIINQEINLNQLLIFDIVVVSIDEIMKQYENYRIYSLNTFYSFRWKRIIVDLSILKSQLIYNLYFINLLNTKYKWIFLQNIDEQVKRITINFILEFFTLEKKSFEKYFSIENQPQQQKRSLLNIAQQEQISQSSRTVETQIILVDFNYEEQLQYNSQKYKNLENYNLEDYVQQFNSLRYLCSFFEQNYEQKFCSFCFIPLENIYMNQVCSHVFCLQCLKYACLLCNQKITISKINKIRQQNTINSQTVRNKWMKLIQLIQNLKGKIVIFTQYPNKLQQQFFNSSMDLSNVKNLSFDQGIESTTQQIGEFDESEKQTILILNPQLIWGQLIIIKSANYLIYYDQIWNNIYQEDIIMKRVQNIKAIFKMIVKESVEEHIIFLQHLQSRKGGREGVLENYHFIKTILQYQQQ
ncbi:unnamed protein product [Paramecium sonneborni]|uniref:RING-type domain-containing protein n=1 Tax=Paramecium sonneborni TaxID=65129 RepID=A0A8S1R0X4_9CILI|nr:unnamed protein product [Paramecium sonneborni]